MDPARFILIFERKEPDVSTLEAAFARRVPNPGRILRTSDAVQQYLNGEAPYTNRELFPFPSMVLLNFDYPVQSMNLLGWLRETGFSAMFPVIGLGGDLPQIIVQRAFDYGLNGYFQKPDDLELLANVICDLQWVADFKVPQQLADGVPLMARQDFVSTR